MQQITLVFWWHAHTNISSLSKFSRSKELKKYTQIPTSLYDIKQLQVRPVQHSYNGFVAVLWGFSAAIIAKRPWSWGWQKRWRGNLKSANFRPFLWEFCLVFACETQQGTPQNEPVYQNHLMIALVGKISIPKHFLEKIIRWYMQLLPYL